jgi:hypothetical protein
VHRATHLHDQAPLTPAAMAGKHRAAKGPTPSAARMSHREPNPYAPSPRYASRTFGSDSNRSDGPDKTTEPVSNA